MRDIKSEGLAPALAVPFGLVEQGFRRLTHLVKEMSQEALEFTGPPGSRNSTAMLLRHLAYADLQYFHMIKGEPLSPELEAEYGPFEDENGCLPLEKGKTAADLLAKYGRVIAMMHEYLASQSDADAERAVHIPWWPEPATVRFVLWHIAGHSMFHQGQITRLQEWYKQAR